MGKNVIITGSNSGFGRLAAHTLALDGHTVFATMRGVTGKNAKAAEELGKWASDKGVELRVVELDVTDTQSIASAVRKVADATNGAIDVVVNNAGQFAAGVLEACTVEQVQALFDINVFGPMRVSRAVLPYMRERQQGLLIQISSVLGRISMPFMGTYCATKFAAEAIAEAYRAELVSLGIDSVIVEPGAFPTEVGAKAQVPTDVARLTGYGDLANAPQRMFEGLQLLFSSPQAPDPQDVADAVKKLIDTPFGQRPARTVVDNMTGSIVAGVNRGYDEGRAEMLKAFGM